MWRLFSRFRGPSGYSASNTAEEVTHGIDATGLTAVITGHFLLTELLLETMKITARKSNIEGRVVNVSSALHWLADKIRFDKINEDTGSYVFQLYAQSKLANILHANELARRLKEEGVQITANSLHPGVITTGIYQHCCLRVLVNSFLGKFLKNVQQGASTTCYIALHPNLKGITGKYFVDNNFSKQSPYAKDTEVAKKLWDFSMNLVRSK
ncbi:hypothetical protein MKX03_018348 [Papaver bracteatum]|nr:hypothetical protein MKX03_018348 [Papaver bracteatum]